MITQGPATHHLQGWGSWEGSKKLWKKKGSNKSGSSCSSAHTGTGHIGLA